MIQVSKRDVDRFGAIDPSVPSIMITIFADCSHSSSKLDYTIPLMGVKAKIKEIHIILSRKGVLSNDL